MIFVITGQTATGKTQLALEYAAKYNGELINFDARQVYQYLDIITGKDLTDQQFHLVKKAADFNIGYYQLTQIPIWLYDIVKPNQYFSSFDYRNLALTVISDIISRGKTPILVGGTYLYFYHLLYRVDTENIPPDFELRESLNDSTVPELQNKLNTISYQSINRLNESDRSNPQRLIRKIEIALHYQKLGQDLPLEFKFKLNPYFNAKRLEVLGLKTENKEILIQRIKQRVEKRLKEGAITEVKKILNLGFSSQDPGLRTIGYQQIIKFIRQEIDEPTMITEWVNKEVQYAKRQLTFMKKDPSIKWVNQ